MVYRVVVGEVQVGDSVLSQGVEPLWFASEDESLEDGRIDLRGWTLEIAHHQLGRAKHGVDAIRKQMADSMLVDHATHPTIEQDVACEDDAQRIGCKGRQMEQDTNSQNCRIPHHSALAYCSGAR